MPLFHFPEKCRSCDPLLALLMLRCAALYPTASVSSAQLCARGLCQQNTGGAYYSCFGELFAALLFMFAKGYNEILKNADFEVCDAITRGIVVPPFAMITMLAVMTRKKERE